MGEGKRQEQFDPLFCGRRQHLRRETLSRAQEDGPGQAGGGVARRTGLEVWFQHAHRV